MGIVSSLHHTLRNHDLGEDGAGILTHVLMSQIQKKEEVFVPGSKAWEDDIVSSLRLCKGIEEGSRNAQLYILTLIKQHWTELSKDFLKSYNYSFDVLVMRETEILPSTFDSYSRTINTFFIEEKGPQTQIEVPVYDEYKNPVKKEGEVVTRFIDFDPTNIPISKLTLVRPLVEQGKMTPTLWSMVADKEVSGEAIRKELYKPVEGNEDTGSDTALRYTLEGNIIIAHEFGEEAEIAEILWETAESEVGFNAIRRLLLMCGIRMDSDEIAKRAKEARDVQIIRIYKNGGQALLPEE